MLRWLEFGRVGRERQQVDMVGDVVGDAQVGAAGFPTGPVEDEHDLFVWPYADLAGICPPGRRRATHHLRQLGEALSQRWF